MDDIRDKLLADTDGIKVWQKKEASVRPKCFFGRKMPVTEKGNELP